MKYVVYYAVKVGGGVNRDYPEYPVHVDVKREWVGANPLPRRYLQHEPHDDYTAAFAAAGMIGQDKDIQRDWLDERVDHLNDLAANAQAAQQAKLIPANPNVYGTNAPGTVVKDQHGRYGKVPQVPLEVFRNKPIDPDVAMDAVRSMGKSGR